MAQFDKTSSVEELVHKALDVMKTEREAIVAGKFDIVYALTDKKSELLVAIDAAFAKMALDGATRNREARQADLRQLTAILSQTAASNMKLLKSAQQGAELARGELTRGTTKAEAGFYGAGGQKIAIEGNSLKEIRKL